MTCMSAHFLNAVQILISISAVSRVDAQDISLFRHTAARLFSLLNLLCLATLAGEDVLASSVDLREDLLDLQGLDKESVEHVRISECKVEVVFQQITNLITDHFQNGALQASQPTILSRAFQELSQGMRSFETLDTLATVQVPFVYLIVTEVIMLWHFLVTPFQFSIWSQGPLGAALWSFLMTYVVVYLHGVAAELCYPFSRTYVAFDLVDMQAGFNCNVASMLHYAWLLPAKTSAAVVKDTEMLIPSHEDQEPPVTCASGPRLRFSGRQLGVV